MASSVKRCWITGFSLLRRISAGSLSTSRGFAGRRLGAQMTVMMMSTGVNSSPSSSRKISPWLMLPPVIEEGGDVVYKFFNLSEEKEESFRKKRSKLEEEIADAKFVGSSHGWLALFNQRNNNNLFLYNPITNRHIKLPPIETLPDPMINLPDGRGSVSKLILSSSPDDDDDQCIAMMTFGPGDRLAFCHPCRSTEWTPIGKLFFSSYGRAYENPFIVDGFGMLYGRAYEDFVYCSRLKRFTCITQFAIHLFFGSLIYPTSQLEDWDLSDPQSPISTPCSSFNATPMSQACYVDSIQNPGIEGEEWINQNSSLLSNCRQIPYLVFDEQHDRLFIVIRFVIDRDSPGVDIGELPYDTTSRRYLVHTHPYKTIGFCLIKVIYHQKDGQRVADGVGVVRKGGLGGLTMFIGMNHSFAVSSADFPNLKPNSIYFTDSNKHANPIYGGHDVGVFDYVNKTLSHCYSHPCVDDTSSKRIEPPPMWFTPNLY
ncbi:hypothetical protein CASFOL_000807 [Castilleja foliolosa]|uniref:KIB1-4 beta-propeller domain-containing protein n=1 Tax=Castilleja foliolosa TaxID=1961234 RepID=A0ABD3ELG2_9LAMI